MRSFLAAVLLASLVSGLSGCGERDQSALYQNGKYRGKPDGRPWDSTPSTPGSGEWKSGDHAAWENALHARNAAQNEYRRIGH